MGRYYYGDIQGKFMFAVQPSDAGERFGAYECPNEPSYIDYAVCRESSYDDIKKELESILKSGAVQRVKHMWQELEKKGSMVYSDKDREKYGVSSEDMREYADWCMGTEMIDFFDENPDKDQLYFEAEL